MKTELETGKRGEELVAAALSAKGHKVIDLTDNWGYRRIDVDFIIKNDKQETTLEVKNDIKSNYTGNFYIETFNRNNTSHNFDGWYYYCEAAYLAFV